MCPFSSLKLFFHKTDTIISNFIWNKKTPRIRKQFLQRPKARGGLALPNLRFYYWATNLRIIQSWLQSDSQHSLPVWLEREAASCSPVSLSALAHSPIKTPSSAYTKNVIVKASLNIWNQFRRFFDLQTYSTLAPLTANHVFPPSLVDGAFTIWFNQGIKTFKDLYNTFASFQQLSDTFALPRQHFFRYLQIRSFVRFLQFPNHPADSPLDTLLRPLPTLKGMMTCIYAQIYSLRLVTLNSIKSLWEIDL